MHSTDSLFQLNALWQNAIQLELPAALEPWLLGQGSLTAQLKKRCKDFRLELVTEHWQTLPDFLQQQWQQPQGLKRDVILWCDGKACVYAQSWWKTAPKFGLLGIAYLVCMVFTGIGLLAYTALTL